MLILIDLDDTLVDGYTQQAYPEAKQCLQMLHNQGHTLILFSHNAKAKDIAMRADLYYTDTIVERKYQCFWSSPSATNTHVTRVSSDFAGGAYGYDKSWNLQQVQQHYRDHDSKHVKNKDVKTQDMILFDDSPHIIQWAKSIGLQTCHITEPTGLGIHHLLSFESLFPRHDVFGYSLSF